MGINAKVPVILILKRCAPEFTLGLRKRFTASVISVGFRKLRKWKLTSPADYRLIPLMFLISKVMELLKYLKFL